MADTMISALTAIGALARGDEFAVADVSGAPDSRSATTGQIETFVHSKGSNVASAATVTLGDGHYFHITGTTTITDIDFTDSWDGRYAILVFDGILTLTHNATTLILPGGANIVTQAGDVAWIVIESGDNVKVINFIRTAALDLAVKLVTGNSGSANNTPAPSETWQILSANSSQNTTTTVATVMTTTGLPVGTYYFEYHVVYQSAATTTGINFQVDYTGTVTRVRQTRIGNTTLATAADGNADQTIATNTGGVAQVWAGRSDAANLGPSAGVDTASADQYEIIHGLLVVSTSADLLLRMASEVASSGVTVMADTCLFLKRLA